MVSTVDINRNAISGGVVTTLLVSFQGQVELRKILPTRMTAPAGTKVRAEMVSGRSGNVKVEIGRNAQ
jgi:hypothetical protein